MQAERTVKGELERVARIVSRRIDLDRQRHWDRGEKKIELMLAFIGEHLFDPRLNINWMKEKVGVRNNSETIFFHLAVGTPPFRYIERARFDAAAALLFGTNMKIHEVAECVGMRSLPTFSRAFDRRFGLRPRRARNTVRRAGRSATSAEEVLNSTRRAVQGIRSSRGVTVSEAGNWTRSVAHQLEALSGLGESETFAIELGARALRLLELGVDPLGIRSLLVGGEPRTDRRDHLLVDDAPATRVIAPLADQNPSVSLLAELFDRLDETKPERDEV